MLGGLGFVLARSAQVGNQRKVNVEAVVAPKVRLELANGLKEGQAFNIAHRTADFDNRNVWRVFTFRKGEHHSFDLVGDVRNNLHGAAQVIAATFLGDNLIVNGTRSGVVLARHGHVEIALVVPEIQIRFRAVVGNEYLAVLERVHGAGVNIDVRIKLLNGYSQPARLQQRAQRRSRKALAQRRQHAARHKNVFSFHGLPPVLGYVEWFNQTVLTQIEFFG